MSEAFQPLTEDQDADLAALFAQRLAPEVLPPGALEQVTHLVLAEVQRTQPALSAPVSQPRRHKAALQTRLRAWLRRLSPGQSLLLAGGGAFVVMLIFIGISRITPRPLTTTAAVSGGSALVLNSYNNRFHIQDDGDQLKLRQGDRVLTDSGSVQLAHFPDHITLIEPGADVELTKLGDDDGGMQLALTVRDGLVRSTLTSPLHTNDQYLIYAPGIVVAAVGTDFVVEAVSEQETLVTSFEGKVSVTMGEQTITLGPGEEVDAVIGKALAVYPTSK